MIKKGIVFILLLLMTTGFAYADNDLEYRQNYNAGCFFIKNKQYALAIEKLTTAAEIKPEAPEIYRELGAANLYLGNYAEAERLLKDALALDQDIAGVHNKLVLLYKTSGRLDDAIIQLQAILRKNSSDTDALFDLGVIYAQKGLYSQAINNFTRIIDIDATNAQAHYNLGLAYYNKKDFSLAKEHYTRAIELNPKYAAAYKNLAAVNVKENQFKQAYSNLQTYAKLSPGASDLDLVELQLAKLKDIIELNPNPTMKRTFQ